MSLPNPISPSQVQAKAPVDADLAGSIKADLDYLYTLFSNAQASYEFKASGPLSTFPSGKGKRIDVGYLSFDQQFSKIKASLGKPGLSGNLEIDLRKVLPVTVPIMGVSSQFSQATQSIGRAGPTYSTQTIVQASAPLAVQSISAFKATININQIISLGSNTWQLILASDIDTDYKVGDSLFLAGCTAPGNNGTFPISAVSPNGSLRVVNITNAAGVAQALPAGTIQLSAVKYNFSNPVDANAFAAGENFVTSGCTAPVHNSTFASYAINSSGSNIVVKSATFAGTFSQASAAGSASCNRWVYGFGATAVDTNYFHVGEVVHATGHTSGGNNGELSIGAVGASSLTVYNASGVAQGGAAGTIQANYWVYSFPIDPTTLVAIGDYFTAAGHTDTHNNGQFKVLFSNSAAKSLTVYNSVGVAQGTPAGTCVSFNKLIQFATDQSATLQVGGFIEMASLSDNTYNCDYKEQATGYKIKAVNFGGGSNYNAVISEPLGSDIGYAGGYVYAVAYSLLTSTLIMSQNLSINPWFQVGMSTNFIASPVTENTLIAVYILQVPSGDPRNLTVQIS